MTVLNLCHSEEARRADVGIRFLPRGGRGFGTPGRRALREVRGGPMYLGHGFRPYGHSIGGTQQRAAREPGASLSRDAQLGQDGFLVGAHEGFLGALVQVVIA